MTYYTEAKGHRWAMMAVDHKTLDRAESDARRTSLDDPGCRVNVYEGGGLESRLLCYYVRGVRLMPTCSFVPGFDDRADRCMVRP